MPGVNQTMRSFQKTKKQMEAIGNKTFEKVKMRKGNLHISEISCKPRIIQRPEATGAVKVSRTWVTVMLYGLPTYT